jgi:hypothetical protein
MVNRHIIDRKLPEKAFMRFYFPSTEGRVPSTIVTMPFFENPVIKESKRARYKKYSLISRSSNLYSYLGADSRKLNLTFSLSLPHLMEEYPQATQSGQYITAMSPPTVAISQVEKAKFTTPNTPISNNDPVARILDRFLTLEGLQDSVKTVLTTDWAKEGIRLQEFDYLKDIYGLDNAEAPEIAFNRFAGELAQSIANNPLNVPSTILNSTQFMRSDARPSCSQT